MALATYSDLKQAIQDWLGESSLESFTDDFIDIAESRHLREIRVRSMMARAQATVSDRFLQLPSGFISMRRLQFNTSPIWLLKQVTPDQMMDTFFKDGSGRPRFYTVHEEIEFNQSPDDSYTAEMIYFKSFTPLSSTNTTNWLLTNQPDIYLYSSLVAAEPFLREDDRINMWDTLYRNSVAALHKWNTRGTHSGGAIRSRVSGSTP